MSHVVRCPFRASSLRLVAAALLSSSCALACGGEPTSPPVRPSDPGGGEQIAPAPEPAPEPPAPEAEAPAEPPAPTDPFAPITDAQRRVLAALPSESITPPPEFYYRSNEWRHDLLVPHLSGLGGAVIGVGSDQLYTFAALARAEWILGVDYDERIPLVHRLYGVLVPASETSEALVERFSEANEAETRAMLAAAIEDDDEEARLLRMFGRVRRDMHTYLGRVRIREVSWLSDPEAYAHIRRLHQSGRVVARTGDLTGQTTMRAVGAALAELGTEARIVYFSNAEQFFPYTDDFIANVKSLPVDERTLAVRTTRQAGLRNARRGRWHYIVQEWADFLERLDSGAYHRSQVMLNDLVVAGPPHHGEEISVMDRQLPRRALERHERAAARGAARTPAP